MVGGGTVSSFICTKLSGNIPVLPCRVPSHQPSSTCRGGGGGGNVCINSQNTQRDVRSQPLTMC